jgi:hypothetical protein
MSEWVNVQVEAWAEHTNRERTIDSYQKFTVMPASEDLAIVVEFVLPCPTVASCY